MKTLVLLLTLMAFVAAAPLAMAEKEAKKADPKINCCIKGKCSKMTKANCDKKKGMEVVDCKDCKAEKKPAKGKSME
ncbi:MAG TPA: hypothetical protein VK463_12150 [Desulfomonilaceae bacterium]|nr:hypothetical protein [Desulfomonilaceae bacterium]